MMGGEEWEFATCLGFDFVWICIYVSMWIYLQLHIVLAHWIFPALTEWEMGLFSISLADWRPWKNMAKASQFAVCMFCFAFSIASFRIRFEILTVHTEKAMFAKQYPYYNVDISER